MATKKAAKKAAREEGRKKKKVAAIQTKKATRSGERFQRSLMCFLGKD